MQVPQTRVFLSGIQGDHDEASHSFPGSVLIVGTRVEAQPPLERILGGGKSNTLSRLPDDQIEGTIYEYVGKTKSKPKKGEKEIPALKGKFRLEGKAIFDISKRLPIPKKDEVKKVIEKAKKGELDELKLPAKPQQKRLGEYRKLSSGKLRLDFKDTDKDGMNGIMIIWPKPKTNGVWLGTYSQKQGKRTVRSWIVELRAIED